MRKTMDLGIKNRSALVCGASKGIGRACALVLAEEGVSVVLLARTERDLSSLVDEIHREDGSAEYLVADLAEIDKLGEIAEKAQSFYGKIDILINNADGPPTGENLSFSAEDWNGAFRLNFLSAQELTKHLILPMEERGWGRIINLTSITVRQPVSGLILSNSIRLAVIGWAKSLASQFAKGGVTINNIATGYTHTERVNQIAQKVAEKEGKSVYQVIEQMSSTIPMCRMAEPEEIASIVAFLAGERASYITGTVIPVDGGFIAGV
jgi:3-oxoacyl-[acyl-carrier protein] reductase